MTEQIKNLAIEKITSGDFSFGIGQREGRRVVSVTVWLPAEKNHVCNYHQLPEIYLYQGERVCEECLKEIHLNSNCDTMVAKFCA